MLHSLVKDLNPFELITASCQRFSALLCVRDCMLVVDKQNVQELRKHLVVLHNVQNQGTGPSMCAACAAIQNLIQDKPEAKQCPSSPCSRYSNVLGSSCNLQLCAVQSSGSLMSHRVIF